MTATDTLRADLDHAMSRVDEGDSYSESLSELTNAELATLKDNAGHYKLTAFEADMIDAELESQYDAYWSNS